ncbi:manganese-dependent inorganic pyrophosphatase [Deinococcus psychrotolerans]|uniref:inorganic diphosphatase n=1 Tax=Deinococcus psychrotolerans TaxID=2489213 RepID=A0A3G8YE72_9DEIO|nr:manganese-dependent inorganic pyrophosphatase [Deinococcus psychrotolerans]AZI42527.1 manganese-dependent inorganic pyrophosphatase [Deinococcus psychrotolerans]
MISVFGHLNPDTDAITAALVYAHFLTRTGTPATPYRLGELNHETAYVLREAGVNAPDLLAALPVGSSVALVDHNESAQSAPNLAELDVRYVVDHHKLGDLSTAQPAFLRFEPLGCTGTLLLKLHREAGLSVEPTDARLLLSAILSDTLQFRSPTTTDTDRDAAAFLAPIAGISDVEGYAMQMFAAKSDLGDMPADKLLKMDYKVFPLGSETWGIGMVETTNPAYVFGRQAELLSAMQAEKAASKLSGILLGVVDILNETNRTLIVSDTEAEVVQAAFGVPTEQHLADLGKLISRKKQIVPALEAYFAQ